MQSIGTISGEDGGGGHGELLAGVRPRGKYVLCAVQEARRRTNLVKFRSSFLGDNLVRYPPNKRVQSDYQPMCGCKVPRCRIVRPGLGTNSDKPMSSDQARQRMPRLARGASSPKPVHAPPLRTTRPEPRRAKGLRGDPPPNGAFEHSRYDAVPGPPEPGCDGRGDAGEGVVAVGIAANFALTAATMRG